MRFENIFYKSGGYTSAFAFCTMLICVNTVEECDARDDASSNAAGNIIITTAFLKSQLSSLLSIFNSLIATFLLYLKF